MLNLVAKGEFARRVNITPGRVSQMIAEGKLAGCLVGEGREQRIDYDKAVEALKVRRDPGQALGNGLKMQLAPAAAPAAVATAPTPADAPRSEADEIDLKLRREKLVEAEARNRKLREEEKARAGTYVLAEHVRIETAKLASTILQMFEGGLSDIGSEIAATYKLPERDLKHLLRKRFREVRTAVSQRLTQEALAAPDLIEGED